MSKAFTILLLIAIGLFTRSLLYPQTNDVGAIGSLSVSKDVGRAWSAKLEQELRFNHNFTTYDRSLTAIKLDYLIVKKVLKAELDYDFIHQRQNDYSEFRHRSSFALLTQLNYNEFEFELRTRWQATWRDENRGDYKYNPKYVWRNKLECTYKIFGSPLKPFISGEVFCPLNSANDFFMDGYCVTMGAKYRVNVHSSLQLQVRYDQEVQQTNAKRIMYSGIGWNIDL